MEGSRENSKATRMGLPRRALNQVAAFHYVTVDNAPTYRAIVEVFFAARERYVIELRPRDVLEELAAGRSFFELSSEESLDYHLGKLVEWGNLGAAHDPGAVSRLEDYYKRRFLYHLTAAGEAAHRAVVEVEATVGRSGSLQSNMLVRITLRELAGASLDEPRRIWISVCENPSVVAAVADRLGSASGPLVCLDGVPSTAALVLLHQLAASGARIRFRADFDWAGILIGNIVSRRIAGATPWRFSQADYRCTLAAAGDAVDLVGGPVTASWDPGLAAAMRNAGTAIQEERLLADLVCDLANAPNGLDVSLT